MGIKQAVTTTFKGKDEQSRIFNKMGKSADKFGEKGSRAFKKVGRSATSAGTIMKGVLGAQVVGKGLGLLSMGVRSVTTDFLNFDNAILSASAKFVGLDLTTKKGIETLERLKKTARKVGAETEFNAAQAASGLDFLALAGFSAEQAMALLPGVTNLATVAQVDLATATDIASDSLGAFGLATKDTEQLAINFTRVQDVMAKTTATSNTNLVDLFESVKKGAPDFTAAGQSIETFSTLIGTMANAGIKGSEAGTKLRNMATRLAKPTTAAEIALEELGVRVDDGKGKFRDMLDILNDVRKGTEKMGKVQRTSTLATIFGVRQTGGLNVILAESDKKLRKYRESLEKSKGAAEKMATVMRSSLINRLKSLGSAATEVGFQLFSAFDEQGASAIDTLTQAVRRIDLKSFIGGIKSLFEFTKGIFNKFIEIGKRTGLFNSVKEAVKNITPILKTFSDIIGTVWGFLERTGVLDLVAKSFGLLFKAIKPLGEAFDTMWKIVKPILEAFEKILKPVVAGLTALIDKSGKILDDSGKRSLGRISKPKLTDNSKKELGTLGKIGSEISETGSLLFGSDDSARNKELDEFFSFFSAKTPPQQQVGFKGQLNIAGAPQGSTFEQEPGPTQVNVSGLN